MNKLLVVLDDETASLLAGEKNKSELVRQAVKYIKQDITPDTIEGMRVSYLQLVKLMKDMDAKIDYIAEKVQ